MDSFPKWLVPSDGAAPWAIVLMGLLALAWRPIQIWAAGAALALEEKRAEWEKRKAEALKSRTPAKGLLLSTGTTPPPCPNVPHPPEAVAAEVMRRLTPYFGSVAPDRVARALESFVESLAAAEAEEEEERLAERVAERVAARTTGEFEKLTTTSPGTTLPRRKP